MGESDRQHLVARLEEFSKNIKASESDRLKVQADNIHRVRDNSIEGSL